MAKSAKKSRDAAPPEIPAAESATAAKNGVSPTVSKPAATGKPEKPARKTTRKRTDSSAVGVSSRKPFAARKKAAPADLAVSDDEIRLRAYFIGERRTRDGQPGDSAADWIEARRQLLEEAARA